MRCMAASFITYIDESGDDGFRFGQGSSDWFVLAACTFRRNREPGDVKVVDSVRAKLNKTGKQHLHFAHLNHTQRLVYISEVSLANILAVVVAVHKPSLRDTGTWQVKNRLYHYATRLLLERISWKCATRRLKGDTDDGTTQLVFSHRRSLSYEIMTQYLHKLRTQSTEIDWSVIDPAKVSAVPHPFRKGLWVADCVASSFYQGLEINQHGFSEGRYASMLRRIMWGTKGAYAGNGIKIFPQEALKVLDLDGQHSWLGEYKVQA
jgi:hypothetical protein